MQIRMNRKKISFASQEDNKKEEKKYWAKASAGKKIEMITYLRECCYGSEATTGRLQRLFTFVKQK
ncbi:MAG: hypothetical protein JW774_04310 [Candidatus Aureabacteria bacterium]|nr:hypothetical protein [Candidatus Auribacterota bacterium]